MENNTSFYKNISNDLSDIEKYKFLNHKSIKESKLPSIDELTKVVDNVKEIIFPGFNGNYEFQHTKFENFITLKIDEINKSLSEQIKRGICFSCDSNSFNCDECSNKSEDITKNFIERLPKIKDLLLKDVIAAYEGDPAAKSYGEIILCYPSIVALLFHRIAHELTLLEVDLIPRILAEIAHSKTGIDIHPGCSIGECFFIDHGTGVVIGETAIIGKNVRVYQGVTLGAKSFPLDENGNPIKGIPRHPIIEDNVTIYSNATILGRITIGENSVIGGNTWVMTDVPRDSKVFK